MSLQCLTVSLCMFQYMYLQPQSQEYIMMISLGKGVWCALSIFYNDLLLRHQTAMYHEVKCSDQNFRDIYFGFVCQLSSLDPTYISKRKVDNDEFNH